MRFIRLSMLLGMLAPAGCGSGPKLEDFVKEPKHAPIRAAAASDLQSVLPKLVAAYRSKTKDEYDVVPTFGSSGQLSEQIRNGAPFDLFLSANRVYVEKLAGRDAVRKESVRCYAIGSAVLAVDRKSAVKIETLADLDQAEVKAIAIANPQFAPYGAAAKEALQSAGLWEKLQPKVVLAESVRQALQYVETGNAEAGIVSRATVDETRVRVIEIDPKLYKPIEQYLGVVTASKTADAEKFAAFVLGDEGRAILKSHGFRLPEAPLRKGQ